MSDFFSIAGLSVACGATFVSLYAVVWNWFWIARRREQPHQSPIMLVGPLFAFLAAGAVAQVLPALGGIVWLYPAIVLVIDPASIPLLVRLFLVRNGKQ